MTQFELAKMIHEEHLRQAKKRQFHQQAVPKDHSFAKILLALIGGLPALFRRARRVRRQLGSEPGELTHEQEELLSRHNDERDSTTPVDTTYLEELVGCK